MIEVRFAARRMRRWSVRVCALECTVEPNIHTHTIRTHTNAYMRMHSMNTIQRYKHARQQPHTNTHQRLRMLVDGSLSLSLLLVCVGVDLHEFECVCSCNRRKL